MRHALIMLLLAAAPASGFGQTAPPPTASKAESQVAQEIAQCMLQTAPTDWQRLFMIVELPEPGAPSGRVRYMATRDFAPDPVPFTPCDPQLPAKLLMESRENLAAERRGWTGARLTIQRDGRFDLNYDYPR
jgi:hypothetical protein